MKTLQVDEIDGLLLNIMQDDFPLTERPFLAMAEQIGVDEDTATARAEAMHRAGIVRQVSAIFDTRALGYRSSLVAFEVPEERVNSSARLINQHPGVSHNYERNHPYNIWFTIATPPEADPEEDVRYLAEECGARYRMLPTLVLYKIGVKLDMTGKMSATVKSKDKGFRRPIERQSPELTDMERAFVREMQKQIEYVPEPFAPVAERVGVTQPELFAAAERLKERKMLRRFAAILRHQKAGYRSNAMGVWAVPPEEADRCGDIMSEFRNISHCYLRPTYPDWPYNLFSMIHGRSKADCEAIAREVQKKTGIERYAMLYSTREFKKTRVEYFTDDYVLWAEKRRASSLAS